MSIADIESLVGESSPPGDWLTVTQDMIVEFADLTGDHQWIHLDVDRCRRESPYGTTVAHGMLIQSLIPKLLGATPSWMAGFSAGINLGSDKVRFTNPVRTGSRIRASWTVSNVADAGDAAVRMIICVTVEVEGESKPACIAELVSVLYP